MLKLKIETNLQEVGGKKKKQILFEMVGRNNSNKGNRKVNREKRGRDEWREGMKDRKQMQMKQEGRKGRRKKRQEKNKQRKK